MIRVYVVIPESGGVVQQGHVKAWRVHQKAIDYREELYKSRGYDVDEDQIVIVGCEFT